MSTGELQQAYSAAGDHVEPESHAVRIHNMANVDLGFRTAISPTYRQALIADWMPRTAEAMSETESKGLEDGLEIVGLLDDTHPAAAFLRSEFVPSKSERPSSFVAMIVRKSDVDAYIDNPDVNPWAPTRVADSTKIGDLGVALKAIRAGEQIEPSVLNKRFGVETSARVQCSADGVLTIDTSDASKPLSYAVFESEASALAGGIDIETHPAEQAAEAAEIVASPEVAVDVAEVAEEMGEAAVDSAKALEQGAVAGTGSFSIGASIEQMLGVAPQAAGQAGEPALTRESLAEMMGGDPNSVKEEPLVAEPEPESEIVELEVPEGTDMVPADIADAYALNVERTLSHLAATPFETVDRSRQALERIGGELVALRQPVTDMFHVASELRAEYESGVFNMDAILHRAQVFTEALGAVQSVGPAVAEAISGEVVGVLREARNMTAEVSDALYAQGATTRKDLADRGFVLSRAESRKIDPAPQVFEVQSVADGLEMMAGRIERDAAALGALGTDTAKRLNAALSSFLESVGAGRGDIRMLDDTALRSLQEMSGQVYQLVMNGVSQEAIVLTADNLGKAGAHLQRLSGQK